MKAPIAGKRRGIDRCGAMAREARSRRAKRIAGILHRSFSRAGGEDCVVARRRRS